MEVEAVDEGVLGKILVPSGTEGVSVNAPIAILLEEGEDISSLKVDIQSPVSNSSKVRNPGKDEAWKRIYR